MNFQKSDQLYWIKIVIMSDEADRKLIEASKAGNNGAYGELVRKYQKPIFNLALRMTGRYDEACDITQNTFIKAFSSLNSYKANFRFFSWIYRMALNESINWIKKNNRLEHLSPHLADDKESPEDKYISDQNRNILDRAIARLKIEARVIIVLRYFADLSYQEIGYIMEIPEKTVKSRLYSARQQLQNLCVAMGIAGHE